MLSAPAHMPAITVVSFGAGLADPDLILGTAMSILSANSVGSPVWAASVITGTSPAHDTRWSSSNTADAGVNLCDTCTGSAFPHWSDCCVGTPIIPAQRALSSFQHTRSPAISPRIEAKSVEVCVVSSRRVRKGPGRRPLSAKRQQFLKLLARR